MIISRNLEGILVILPKFYACAASLSRILFGACLALILLEFETSTRWFPGWKRLLRLIWADVCEDGIIDLLRDWSCDRIMGFECNVELDTCSHTRCLVLARAAKSKGARTSADADGDTMMQ